VTIQPQRSTRQTRAFGQSSSTQGILDFTGGEQQSHESNLLRNKAGGKLSMKQTPIALSVLLIGLSGNLYGQGQLVLNNIPNTSTSTSATSNGLFWLSTGGAPVLINQDFNAAFYAGTDSSSLSLISTILLNNGTGLGDNAGGPGTFGDPSGAIYTFQSLTSVFVEIQAWTGNFNSYAAAVSASAPAAQSPIFRNPLGVPPASPADLEGMPAMVLGSVPEPSTFALVGLGGLCALVFLRRHKNNRLPC